VLLQVFDVCQCLNLAGNLADPTWWSVRR